MFWETVLCSIKYMQMQQNYHIKWLSLLSTNQEYIYRNWLWIKIDAMLLCWVLYFRTWYHTKEQQSEVNEGPCCLARHPGSHTRSSEATHILETGTSHGEVANKVPNESADLEDGGDGSEDETLQLWNGQRRVKKDVMSYATKQVATKRLKMQSKEVYVRDCETSTENPVSNAVPPTT